MNLNKLTEKAQESVLAAQKLAETLGHAQIEPEHLLISLLEQQDGVAPAVLRKMNADPADLARVMRGEIARGPQAYGGAQPGVSPRLNLVVDLAEAEAGRMKDEYVSTEHLLIAIAGETGRSPAAKLLDVARHHARQALRGAHERPGIAACHRPEP